MNDGLAERIAGIVTDATTEGDAVAVLGLAYKDNTPVVEESAGAKVAAALAARGRTVVVHDPIADAEHSSILMGVAYQQASDVADAVADAAAIVIVGDDPAYDGVPAMAGTAVIVDCWRRYPGSSWPSGTRVIALGRDGTALSAGGVQ